MSPHTGEMMAIARSPFIGQDDSTDTHRRETCIPTSASAYTAYLIHPLVIVGLAYAARGIPIHPLLKFGLAVLVAVPLCFGMSDAIRRLPLARRIL